MIQQGLRLGDERGFLNSSGQQSVAVKGLGPHSPDSELSEAKLLPVQSIGDLRNLRGR